MSADVVAVPLVDKYKRDVAPAVAMNYNASAATTRDADRIGRSEGPTVTVRSKPGRRCCKSSSHAVGGYPAGQRRRIDGAIVAICGSASNRRPIDAG
jgi:hypothetical protein